MDWAAMAAPWLRAEAATDAAHRPVLDGLIARAGLSAGQKVLDVGPGGGVSLLAAAEVVGPSGHVTGIDVAPPFVARARERVPPHVTVIEGNAETHPFAPNGFDAAISLFGVMFFTDSVAGFRNIRAGLKPRAALTFACWGAAEHNPWFTMPGAIAAEVFGPGPPSDPSAPGPMRFADPVALRAIMQDAGWTAEVEEAEVTLTPPGRVEDVAAMQMTIGAGAMRMRLAKEAGTLTHAHKDALRARLTRGFAAFDTPDGVRVPARITYVRAVA